MRHFFSPQGVSRVVATENRNNLDVMHMNLWAELSLIKLFKDKILI